MPKSDDQSERLGRISNMFNRDGGSEPPVGIYVPQAMYDDFVKICAPIKQIRPDYPFEIKLREPWKRPTVRWNRSLGFCGGRGADNRLHDR